MVLLVSYDNFPNVEAIVIHPLQFIVILIFLILPIPPIL